MFWFLALGGLGLFLATRSSSSSDGARPADGGLAPRDKSVDEIENDDLARESLFDNAGGVPDMTSALPTDLTGLIEGTIGSFAKPATSPYWPSVPDFIIPSEADGGPLGLTVSAESKVPRKLPAGVTIRELGIGAPAPLRIGERVTMHLKSNEHSYGEVEGTYSGPSDPSAEDAYVFVDRISDAGAASVPFGRYTIPSSKNKNEHTLLERVVWGVLDPEDHKLGRLPGKPAVDVGDLVTVLVRDLQGNVVVALARVTKIADYFGEDLFHARLEKPYKKIVEEGSGAIVFPQLAEQGTIAVRRSMLVDPKTIPA